MYGFENIKRNSNCEFIIAADIDGSVLFSDWDGWVLTDCPGFPPMIKYGLLSK